MIKTDKYRSDQIDNKKYHGSSHGRSDDLEESKVLDQEEYNEERLEFEEEEKKDVDPPPS